MATAASGYPWDLGANFPLAQECWEGEKTRAAVSARCTPHATTFALKLDTGTTMRKVLIGLYVVCAVLTLVFQVHVRSPLCSAAGNCPTSFAKAVVWSTIWPASWVVYWWGANVPAAK
jgi:hypothetical protein